MRTILIGMDDTDNLDSPGTGRLARDLCAELTKKGMKSLGVTRHQFLLDDAIPYTSHNSGACIAVESKNGIESVKFVFDFVAGASAEGSDPGVAVTFSDEVPQEVFDFGRAAQKKILTIENAFNLANDKNIRLRSLGGNGQGVIGALASVGLRAQGNDGRFIDMPGLRELPRCVNAQTYDKIGIEIRYETNYHQPDSTDVYDTLGWVRPRLMNGKAVLIVEWSEKENAWLPIDRKKSKHSKDITKSSI
jgi:hypothetical protein